MAFKFFEQCIYYMLLVHQLSQEVKDELCLFIKTNKDKLNLIAEFDDFKKKMEYWKKLSDIIQKYEFEIFFRELELIIRFCFLASSDNKYISFFDAVRVHTLAQNKFKIIDLLEFEKVKLSLRLDQMRLDYLYNIKYYL
uniref:Uncharacterized protein n=1 Tax=viral metagenome TaxID=1070528 RepID=A0A6C0I1J8_9ZZZZ